jgi:uncharacterized protein (DUF1330 family)
LPISTKSIAIDGASSVAKASSSMLIPSSPYLAEMARALATTPTNVLASPLHGSMSLPNDRQHTVGETSYENEICGGIELDDRRRDRGRSVDRLHAQARPPVYLVTEIEISNVDAYVKEYAPLAQASIKASAGRLLAAGQNITAVEGTPPKSRVAIQQWDSVDKGRPAITLQGDASEAVEASGLYFLTDRPMTEQDRFAVAFRHDRRRRRGVR